MGSRASHSTRWPLAVAGTVLALATSLASGQPALPISGAPEWQELSPSQRTALAPLQSQWQALDAARRGKWVELANRFHTLPPEEQARVRDRMASWSDLTPSERGRARVQYQEAQRWTPSDRKERWREYQSLHPDARQVLAERWKLEAAAAKTDAARPTDAKRNLIESRPQPAKPSAPASPTTVRAQAGATSTSVSSSPGVRHALPSGVPKVAATAAFVDPVTLLPRRGPQAAAMVAPRKPDKSSQ